jgi:phosphate/sulfate permease
MHEHGYDETTESRQRKRFLKHNRSHYVSAGAVSFARGLNDTPKIAALMLLIPDLRLPLAMALDRKSVV